MSTPSRTPYAVLGCLTIEPMSGYGIRRFLERTVAHFWSESPGQIYPTVRKLEADGLIRGRTEPGERGRDRRVYRITDTGRQELRAWLAEPPAPARPRYEHTLKLFFGHEAGPDASLRHVERLRRQTEETLAHYRRREKELRERARAEPNSQAPYWLVVLRGGVRYSEMVMDWCDETERTLRALPEPLVREGPGGAPCPEGG